MPDEDFSGHEKAGFELQYMSAPISRFALPGNEAMVLEVNERYSPRITLYNLLKGTTGVMKVKKERYRIDPLKAGDIIAIQEWTQRPRYRFVPASDGGKGKPAPVPGQFDLWMLAYRLCARISEAG